MISVKGLTLTQKKVLDAIREFQADRGYSPTVRELASILGVRSISTVFHHLAALERKGYIRHVPYASRTLVIIQSSDGPARGEHR